MLHFIIGTKAQLIKVAPVLRNLDQRGYPYRWIDSGQHAEFTASQREDLDLRSPDYQIADRKSDVVTVRGGIGWLLQITKLWAFYPRLVREELFDGCPGPCIVHGDTVSTIIGAILARRAGHPVAHLEAGLRSHSVVNPFPEELIRIWTTRLSAVLYAPDEVALSNLSRTRPSGRYVHTHGSTVVDALRHDLERAKGRPREAPDGKFALVTCHRLETLRSRHRLQRVVHAFNRVSESIQVVFVIHRPTLLALKRTKLIRELSPSLIRLPPQKHVQFVNLLSHADFVLADGGSIQEECAALGKPLLIIRQRTERPDGLGINARLFEFRDSNVERFLRDLELLRNAPNETNESPARIVTKDLIEWDREIMRDNA